MAIIEIQPEPIIGPWSEGFVLVRHMLGSVPLGYDEGVARDDVKAADGCVLAMTRTR